MMAKRQTKTRRDEYDPDEWDESRSVHVNPEPRMKAGVSTSIRLPRHMVAKLRRVAERKGDIGYQALLKMWIAERLEKESA
jgi:hypothetical protein